LGGLLGGLFYIASYNIFPYFRELIPFSNMVGASASVLAIVLATAYREPNYPINLLFIGTVRLKYIALFVVLTDLLFITSDNGGGHLAHLGGALAGIWFCGYSGQEKRSRAGYPGLPAVERMFIRGRIGRRLCCDREIWKMYMLQQTAGVCPVLS
jgi:membrane associated rhomboid family serine protease